MSPRLRLRPVLGLLEVCIFTALLGLAMNACRTWLPVPDGRIPPDAGIQRSGKPGVRDYMLKYMGEQFCGERVQFSVDRAV